jgi:uncharacterized protein involved in type VI secretion and phage assembly
MSNGGAPFIGKYRGTVSDNRDPNSLSRIRARVPDVLGDQETGWAMPCVPYAGDGVGLFLLPPTGASVWIEFEHGDPDYPIWSGCFWAQGQVPASPAVAEKKVLKTGVGTITLDDTTGSGGITIETSDGKKVVMNSTGIEINAGQGTIKINGTQVSVNDGALEVI